MHNHPCRRIQDIPARWIACFVFSFVVLIAPSRAALADCPVEDWLSGQIVAGNIDGASGGDGIGGSGRAPGSGGDEDGIGGSGIFGTITAFGSICINGQRVLYDEGVAITVDGRSMSSEDLTVGQVVFVEIVGQREELHAISIDVQHVLVGPVTAIEQDAVEVMGERIDLDSILFDEAGSIETGTRLAISGLRDVMGMIVASRIDLAAKGDQDLVRGIVHLDEEGQRRIGRIRMLLGKAGSPSRPILLGKRERRLMRGEWNAGSLRFEVDGSVPSPTMLSGSGRFDVEGYVRRISSDEIQVGDARFSSDVGFRDVGDVGLVSGDRVRVRGIRSRDDGSLRATSVQRVSVHPFLRSLDRNRRGPGVVVPGIDGTDGAEGPVERRVDGHRTRQADESGRRLENGPIDRPRDYRIDHPRPERPDRPAPRHDLIDGRKAIDRR